MKKVGGSHHLKRHPAPVFWPIHRKTNVWTVKPKAGTHSVKKCIPLLLLVRDILDLAKSSREAKKIISDKQILVDGRFILEYDFPIGLMDVIEIPKVNEAYRFLPSPHNIFKLHKIKGKEKSFKLFKIIGKTILKNKQLQLNLHDGQNILISIKESENPKDQEYKTSDVLKIRLLKKKILDHTKIRKGTAAMITDGKNIGVWGKITKISKRKETQPVIVTLERLNGKKLKTSLKNIFTIGHEEPWISLPEERQSE